MPLKWANTATGFRRYMGKARSQSTTVLPPVMEASRRAIFKTWLCIILPITVPVCFLVLPFTQYVVKARYGLLFNVFCELAAIYAFTFVEFRVVQLYIERISKKLGYICLHCGKSLFQPTKNSYGAVEVTGLCPSCKAPVVPNLDSAVGRDIGNPKKSFWIKIRGGR